MPENNETKPGEGKAQGEKPEAAKASAQPAGGKGAQAEEKTRPESQKGPAKPGPQPTTAKRPLAATLIAVLALIIACAAGGGVYFIYQHQQQQSTAFSDRLGQLASSLDTNRQELEQATAETREALAQETQARKEIAAQQDALNAALANISAKLGRTTMAWRLAEVDYLLNVANDRLGLAQDRRTALVALETADQKLRALGDPVFVPVRQVIADELTALRAVQEPDIAGMALTLRSLAQAVAGLPLLNTTPARLPEMGNPLDESHAEQNRDWRAIAQAVWEDLKRLVVIRRHDQPAKPLLPPEQEWFLRQNLQLKLEQAGLSLLRRETAPFRAQLADSEAWLQAYFDPQAPAVKGMLDTLDGMKPVELRPELPDISASLRTLREQMRSLGETGDRAGAGGAES